MKLLFCDLCWDVFSLSDELRSCKCGTCKGKYINKSEAVVNGGGYSIAIGNGSLVSEICHTIHTVELKPNTDRGQFLKQSELLAWVRPHSGEGNPHTTVDKDL